MLQRVGTYIIAARETVGCVISHVGMKMVCESRDKEHTLLSRVRATHLVVGLAVATAGQAIYREIRLTDVEYSPAVCGCIL